MTHRRITALAVAVALASGVAGCASAPPPVDPPPAPAVAPPVLDAAQESAILADVGETLAATAEARSAKGLAARLSGPALAIRKSELAVAKTLKKDDYLTELPTSVVSTTTTTEQGWPRSVVAVSEQPELQTERLLVLTQDDARSDYRLWAWARLFPKVVLPPLATVAVGSPQLAPDAEGLLVTPQAAVDAYADVLTKPKKSEHLDELGDDPFREQVAKISALQNKALKAASGKQTMTFTPVPGSVVSIGTVDGGAIVVGEMTVLEVRTAEDGATISPGTDVEKALTKKLDVANEMTISYTTVVALRVPPAGSADKITALGVEHVATGASIPK